MDHVHHPTSVLGQPRGRYLAVRSSHTPPFNGTSAAGSSHGDNDGIEERYSVRSCLTLFAPTPSSEGGDHSSSLMHISKNSYGLVACAVPRLVRCEDRPGNRLWAFQCPAPRACVGLFEALRGLGEQGRRCGVWHRPPVQCVKGSVRAEIKSGPKGRQHFGAGFRYPSPCPACGILNRTACIGGQGSFLRG